MLCNQDVFALLLRGGGGIVYLGWGRKGRKVLVQF